MNFLMQSKLDESEWKTIEKPLTNKKEIQILKMINEGFHKKTYNFQTIFLSMII